MADGLVRDPRFCQALKAKAPMPIDIYDALAWSAITPLSEQSIARGQSHVRFSHSPEGSGAPASRSLR